MTQRHDRQHYPVTPDQRYFLVAGRLWRSSDPALPADERQELVGALMTGRRAVKIAKRNGGDVAAARRLVDDAKRRLGERGPPWWRDGAPDYNRQLAKNTPYSDWARQTGASQAETG